MKKEKISVALAVFNEEKNLSACLDSVKNWVDEIVVVDGGSSDKTVAVAEKHGAKVIETTNPPIFHINKQKAIDACKGDWILQLDADEQVSSKLAQEIKEVLSMSDQERKERKLSSNKHWLFERHQQILAKRDGKINQNGGVVAYFVSRKNYFLGTFLKHGGVYPDGVIRLIKKNQAYFPCRSVHEQIKIKGEVAWLESSLLHFPFPEFSNYLEKSICYSQEKARQLFEKKANKGKIPFRILIDQLFLRPTIVFFWLYFRHLGFKDGFPGFVFAFFSSVQEIMALVFYFELGKNE